MDSKHRGTNNAKRNDRRGNIGVIKIYTLELEGLEKSASKSHESLTLPKHNAVSRNTTDSFIVTPTAKPESKLSTKSHEKNIAP